VFCTKFVNPYPLVIGIVVLLCLGCAGPTLTSRIIQQDSSWFVRLDSLQDTGNTSPRYDHPITWRDEDLSVILSRMILQERVGLMDNARPPRPVFAFEEINRLAHALRTAFQEASSREWIVFVLFGQEAGGPATTSGAIFVESGKLHLVIANHQLKLADDSEELAHVRANPLYSVHGSGGVLGFDAPRFVVGNKANWSGGHRASASEMILDHTAFLTYLTQTGSAAATLHEGRSNTAAFAPDSGAHRPKSTSTGEMESEGIILRLREEIEILKRRLADKDAELDRLKHHEIRTAPTH